MADTTKKIIRGVVNSRGFTITSPITQWDYGWQFIPEIEDLPPTYRLDFSNEEKHGTALPVYCSTEGAEVPTELIDTGKDIWVWFVRIGEGYGITEYKWRVPNKCRPSRDGEIPTPTQQSSIDQLITRSNEAVESAEQSAEQAGASAQSASQSAESAEQSAQTSRGWAESAEDYAQSAEQSELQASASATASAQIKADVEDLADDAQASADASERSASHAYTYATSAERSSVNASASAQSASGYASQAQGYAQTASIKASEASASADLASRKASEITGLTAQANTLPSGSSATASYLNGTLTLGIPRGADGDDYVLTEQDKQDIANLVDVPVDDVQINGTSIVTDGVAIVPIASKNALGVTIIGEGLSITNNKINVQQAPAPFIKAGANQYNPITPYNQHDSVFFGLAKASGDTTQKASSNAVGTYTEDAKSKISEMLGGSVSVSGTTPTIVAKAGIRYVCGEVATLDFTPSQAGICDVVFTSGATATVLTVPSTIKWANDFDPTSLEANTTYEINIMDGLGVAVGWT